MNSAIDANSKATITARLNTDGITVEKITADPVTHRMSVNNDVTGSVVTDEWAATDDNGRPTMFAVSSADGKTLIALQADATGHLLVKST
jgi:hypothetical protein